MKKQRGSGLIVKKAMEGAVGHLLDVVENPQKYNFKNKNAAARSERKLEKIYDSICGLLKFMGKEAITLRPKKIVEDADYNDPLFKSRMDTELDIGYKDSPVSDVEHTIEVRAGTLSLFKNTHNNAYNNAGKAQVISDGSRLTFMVFLPFNNLWDLLDKGDQRSAKKDPSFKTIEKSIWYARNNDVDYVIVPYLTKEDSIEIRCEAVPYVVSMSKFLGISEAKHDEIRTKTLKRLGIL